MDYQIVWRPESENDFKNTIVYLKENGSVLAAESFVFQTGKKDGKYGSNAFRCKAYHSGINLHAQVGS